MRAKALHRLAHLQTDFWRVTPLRETDQERIRHPARKEDPFSEGEEDLFSAGKEDLFSGVPIGEKKTGKENRNAKIKAPIRKARAHERRQFSPCCFHQREGAKQPAGRTKTDGRNIDAPPEEHRRSVPEWAFFFIPWNRSERRRGRGEALRNGTQLHAIRAPEMEKK